MSSLAAGTSRCTGLTVDPQQQTQWCWAAVSNSVSHFYDPNSTWTQCTVVDAELGQQLLHDRKLRGLQPARFLDWALTRVGCLQSMSAGTLPFVTLRSLMNADTPPCARQGWAGGGGLRGDRLLLPVQGGRNARSNIGTSSTSSSLKISDHGTGLHRRLRHLRLRLSRHSVPGRTATLRSPGERALALIIEQLPKAERVIDATLVELRRGGIGVARSTAPVMATTPLPVYHLGADAIAEGRGLAAATHVGWIATVRNGSEVMGSLELAPNPPSRAQGPPARFAGFAQGPLHRGLARIVEAAGKQGAGACARGPPCARSVLAGALVTDGDSDTLVPIGPAPAPLKAGAPMSANDALSALSAAAKRALEGDATRS
jgi:hypothetical protein